MKRRTKILIAVAVILVTGFLAGMVAYNHMEDNLVALTKTTMPSLNLEETTDGTYQGSYSAFPVSADVEVKVENHRIVSIDLTKHVTGQGQAAEGILDVVLIAQSVDVEAVSGATYSSVVILKAIENALVSAGAKPI